MRALVITAMGRPSAQAASQNPRPERDAPSFCDPWRKAHPRFRLRVGCRFRIGLSRKLRPRIRPQNGTCFPDCPSSGNYIPDFGSKPGCAFPAGPLAETTSRNERSERDALSRQGIKRKPCPGPRLRMGCAFPAAPLAEIAPRIEHSEWDAFSGRGLEWKARLGIWVIR